MEIWEMTASEAVASVQHKRLKAREVVEAVLSRKKEVEPEIRAFIGTMEEEAVKQADSLDRRVEKGEKPPPAAGIPLSLKDDLCWENGSTTCGAGSLRGYKPPFNSAPAQRLRDSGAVITGKTNLDQWSMGGTTESSSFRVTLNPRNLQRVAGDGAAASVAAGSSMLALGSDTGGGLRQGASYCGVMGLRPTPGLISRYGLISFSSSFSQVGLLSRSVDDISLALDLVCGFDYRDASTGVCPAELPDEDPAESYKAALPTKNFEQVDEKYAAVFKDAISSFSGRGVEINEVDLPHFSYGLMAYYVMALAEASSNLSRFDGIRFGEHFDGETLEEWYCQTRGRAFGEEARRRSILGAFFLNENNYHKYYYRALQVWTLVKQEFSNILKSHRLIFLPVVPAGVPAVGEQKGLIQKYEQDRFCAPVSLAGLPAICLPVAVVEGMPVGIQIVGAPFSEKMLLRAARKISREAGALSPVKDIGREGLM